MNTWIRNKIANCIAIVSYPIKLIPAKGFTREISIQSLSEIGPIGLVRRSLKLTKEDTFDKFGRVREDALISHKKDVPGLSLNLLGGTFLTKHICFLVTKDAGKEWDGLETQLWRKYIKWVTYQKPSIPIYFLLENLHNQTFPYHRKNDKDVAKMLKALNITPQKEGDDIKLYGASIIKHVASRLNYWHAEFRLLDIEARETGSNSKIVREKVKSYPDSDIADDIKKQHWITQAASYALHDILLHTAFDDLAITDYKEIERRFFLN